MSKVSSNHNGSKVVSAPSRVRSYTGFRYLTVSKISESPLAHRKGGRPSRIMTLPQWREALQFIESKPGPLATGTITITPEQAKALGMKNPIYRFALVLREVIRKKYPEVRCWRIGKQIVIGSKSAVAPD